MNTKRILTLAAATLLKLGLLGCGQQEQPAPAPAPEPSPVLPISTVAEEMAEVACSYAPSQSDAVRVMEAIARGHMDAAEVVAKATGLAMIAVRRPGRSGRLFKGAGRHIAARLGAPIVAPSVISVSVMIGTTATTLELLCVPINHPEFVRQVESSAIEFEMSIPQAVPKVGDKLMVPPGGGD